MQRKSITGGCVREGLITEAKTAGRRWRNAVRRGDFRSAQHAWDAADHSVGAPYMTVPEYFAARAAFVGAAQ